MLVSAEIRWFWDSEPHDLARWFRSAEIHTIAAGGGGTRTDEYLRDAGQAELGIKRRGGKSGVEVKGLVALRPELSVPPFQGPVELWTKWTSDQLAPAADLLIAIRKQRWLRKFDTGGTAEEIALDAGEKPLGGRLPEHGCHVELTRIGVAGAAWWSLGFEAFGSLDAVEHSLQATAEELARRDPPPLPPGRIAGYPAWLRDRLVDG